jgi:Domain of unknown function (DUF4148)
VKRRFLFALTWAGCAALNAAHAETSQPAAGKSRAQVLAELCRAEQSGIVPIFDGSYPPDSWTIERNRENFRRSGITCPRS